MLVLGETPEDVELDAGRNVRLGLGAGPIDNVRSCLESHPAYHMNPMPLLRLTARTFFDPF